MSQITARGVTRTYPGHPAVVALRGVDLDVPEGELVAVLGPSGCGKTTLLRSIAGLEQPDGGTIELGGMIVDAPGTHVPPERRRVGLVPQEGALFPHLDVSANIAFGIRSLPKAERNTRIDDLLELVGLAGSGGRRPSDLSGGQQQRVALARALAPRPVVVLLDEPFSALDAGLRGSLRDEVTATLRTAGTTAILVTHDQAEALTMADTIAVMRDGSIVQAGPPAQIYRNPVDLWTARFLGDIVELPGSTNDRVRVCRPEQLHRVAAHTVGAFAASITSVRFQGPDAAISLDLGGVAVSARWPSADLPAVGDQLHVAVAGSILEFPLAQESVVAEGHEPTP